MITRYPHYPIAEEVEKLEADNARLRARLLKLCKLVGLAIDDGGGLEVEVEYLVEQKQAAVLAEGRAAKAETKAAEWRKALDIAGTLAEHYSKKVGELECNPVRLFSRALLVVAAGVGPEGRLGANDVLVSAIRRRLDIDLAGAADFKARVLEAYRAGFLHLVPADRGAAVDLAELGESEVADPEHPAVVFHLVRLGE